MTRIVIDKENEITKLENMLETLTDEKDKQSVRFAINVISGFNEVLSERPQGEWIFLGDNPNRDNPNQSHSWSCNKCGRGVKEQENFCPNCGADMRKGGAE